jgi:2-hydroxychromene-2-carboxylate isomerase
MGAPLRWYFDFLSPFSYLHWQKVKALRATHVVEAVPVVFGAVLSAKGQLGPAEIPGKREFTYRHVLWQARAEGVPLVFPPAHPFNPLGALRACIAAGSGADAVDAIFDWIWRDGRPVDGDAALLPLLDRLGLTPEAIAAPQVKAALRANTEAAIAAGVYGVPTLQIGDQLFWGNDAHPFALAALHDPSVLQDGEMQRVSKLPIGITRKE